MTSCPARLRLGPGCTRLSDRQPRRDSNRHPRINHRLGGVAPRSDVYPPGAKRSCTGGRSCTCGIWRSSIRNPYEQRSPCPRLTNPTRATGGYPQGWSRIRLEAQRAGNDVGFHLQRVLSLKSTPAHFSSLLHFGNKPVPLPHRAGPDPGSFPNVAGIGSNASEHVRLYIRTTAHRAKVGRCLSTPSRWSVLRSITSLC